MDDATLLNQFVTARSADAFAELVRRHAGLVYGACLRVTGDSHDAEDAAQECFLELSRRAAEIQSSPAGWLHGTATRRAVDLVRSRARSRKREQTAAERHDRDDAEPSWQEIAPLVDQALAELPDQTRLPLVLHYLEGRSQTEVAAELGVNQATVSRRLSKGVEALRAQLRRAGIAVPIAVLALLLQDHAAHAAPPALAASLGKMAMAGVGQGGAAAGGGAAAAGSVSLVKVTTVGVLLALAGLAVWQFRPATTTPTSVPAPGGAVSANPVGNGNQAGATVNAPETLSNENATTMEEESVAKQTPRPDYMQMEFSGNGMHTDSVAHVLKAAATAFGADGDYDVLACFDGHAFAPAINPDEDCLSHWMVEGHLNAPGLPLAAAHVGLTARPIDVPAFAGNMSDEAQWAAHRSRVGERLVEPLASGALVVALGGWDIKGPRGFAHWGFAGVVTEVDPQAQAIRGEHLWNISSHPLKWPKTFMALRPRDGDAEAEVDPRAVLKEAVQRIRAEGPYARSALALYGVDAMDLWIRMMSQAPGYCAQCYERVGATAGDARNNARRVRDASRLAAGFLRRNAARFGGEAQLGLETAAAHYDRIVELLDPAVSGRGGEAYDAFLGDMAKQREHAREVLEPVKQHLVLAAGAMALALDEDTPERLVLDGVPPVSFPGGARQGDPQLTPFPSCLAAVLHFLGEDFGTVEVDHPPLPPIHPNAPGDPVEEMDKTYLTLMGASGAAFRMNWDPTWESDGVPLHLMSDDPVAPYRRAFAATGRGFTLLRKDACVDAEAEFRAAIRQSIARGLPVLARGVIGPPEYCIVSGYDEKGDVLIGWNFFQNEAEDVAFEPDGQFRKRDWLADTCDLILLGPPQPRPSAREVHVAALKWALQVMRTRTTHGNRVNGLAAFDAWREALLDDAAFEGLDRQTLEKRYPIHMHTTDMIAEPRWYAHNYLKTAARDLPEVSDALREAAELCRTEHDIIWEMWNASGGWRNRGPKCVDVFAKPQTRQALAAMVARLKQNDTAVAGLIERVLTAWDVE